MKKITLLGVILFFMTCKKDSTIPTPCNQYEDYQVNFFNSHDKYVEKPAQFEEVVEQVLIKPVYRKGATFYPVYIKYEKRVAYVKKSIIDSSLMHIVTNMETNKVEPITYFHFFYWPNFKIDSIPPEYSYLEASEIARDGDGEIVPAEYATVHRYVLEKESKVLTESGLEKGSYPVTFRIRSNVSIQKYLKNQFEMQGIEDCIEGETYEIVD